MQCCTIHEELVSNLDWRGYHMHHARSRAALRPCDQVINDVAPAQERTKSNINTNADVTETYFDVYLLPGLTHGSR